MTHFAFVAPPFLGHVNPMLALARELVRRGHRATFLHMADAAPLVRGTGIPFRPVGQGTHPPGTLAGIRHRMATIRGLWGLAGIIRDVASTTDMLCRDLPSALREIAAEAIVADQSEAAGGLVAAHLGMPVVSVANALPLNREPGVPPPFTSWRYDASHWGTERNLGGYRVSDILMRGPSRVISGHAATWRIGERCTIEDCASPLAQVSQTVEGFDMPRAALPDMFHHVGPLRDPEGVDRGFRLPEPDGRPLVYASLGTLQGGRVSIFRRIAESARRLDCRLIVAHGGALTPAQVATLPGRPDVHDFVPQDVVLRGASLAVLNGGLNTVMDAMTHGVPVVAVPIAFEQGAIAARLERAGAGRSVSRRFLTAGRMERAMREVATNPLYRARSRELAREVARGRGVDLAADIVEIVARTGRPVTREMMAMTGMDRAERAA